jgi:6-phosphogluconolactonase
MGKKIKTLQAQDGEELAVKTVENFYRALEGLLEEEDKITVSLPGGRSVQPFYSKIPEYTDNLSEEDWKRVHFFWTDERLVPPDSPESNYGLAQGLFLEELLNQGQIERRNIHRFPGEAEDIPGALDEYENELRKVSDGQIHLPVLGVGGDGHVGSLFPGGDQLKSQSSGFLMVSDSPKPPKRRMTISPSLVRESDEPFLFFIGEEKREAYRCFRSDEKKPHDCPCKLAREGKPGTVHVVTDLKARPV